MKTYITKMKHFVDSQNFKKSVKVIGIFAIALLIFQAGVFVGFRKASFYGAFGNNFRKNFGEQRGGPRGMLGRDIPNAHGVVGSVVDISLPTIVVAGDDGIEKLVLVGEKCLLRKFRENITAQDLVVGDSVVVIGMPGKDGKIKAQLIRIMPKTPAETVPTDTNLETN
jgi:hypothetical protein